MKKLLLTVMLACAVSAPATASAQQWFDFNGQALLPAAVGQDLTLYAVINNNGIIDTPLPLDFANFEYTLVVTGLTLVTDNGGGGQTYGGGQIAIYQDAGTAADYTSPASFVDGSALLSGDLTSLTRSIFGSIGSAGGVVNWTGGANLDDLAPADRLGWAFLTGISNRSTVTEPGYDENWDGKVEPTVPVVSTGIESWSSMKAQFESRD
jgi:hypothetical protein